MYPGDKWRTGEVRPIDGVRCISRIREKAGERSEALMWSAAALVRRSKAKTDAAAFFVGSLLPTL